MNILQLRKFFSAHGFVEELTHSVKRIEVPPKTILLNEGEIAKKLFIVEKGCIREFFYKDGKDITFQFFFENDAVASFDSFFNSTPSQFYLESIEKTKILVLNKKQIDNFMEKHPEVQKEIFMGLIGRFLHYANHHFMSFLKDKPIERYLDLLEKNPAIIQRVPHHYIASYLGITSVSLSRLRNKIARKK